MNRFSLKIYGLGVVLVLILLGLSTVVLTGIMAFTDVSEAILPPTGRIVRIAAVFIASIVAAKRAGGKGLIYGAAIAGTVVVILASLGGGGHLFAVSWLNVAIVFLAGIFGGMVGIGLSD